MHWRQRFFNKETAESTTNTSQFTPLHNHKIRSERAGSGVAALCWRADELIRFTLASSSQHNLSYLILPGAPMLEFGSLLCIYIPAKHHARCMMKGGGCSGASEPHPFPEERGVNSRLYCCLGLPGLPRENIQRGVDAAKERHGKLFIEKVKRSGGGKWGEGVENKKGRDRKVWRQMTECDICGPRCPRRCG